MICNKCKNKGDIISIYNHKEYSCLYCSEKYAQIEIMQKYGREFCMQRILNLLEATDRINIQSFKDISFNYNRILQEITSSLSIKNTAYKDNNDKNRILYNIMGVASGYLIEQINLCSQQNLFCFMSVFEYNRFIAGARIANLTLKDKEIKTQDDFVNTICTIERGVGYNVVLELGLAKDRWILDMIISCIFNVGITNSEWKIQKEQDLVKTVSNIFLLGSLVFELREMLFSDEIKMHPIVIDKEGMIKLHSKKDFTYEYGRFITSDRTIVAEGNEFESQIENDIELNKYIKDFFGLTMNEMIRLHTSIENLCNLDELMIGSKDLWHKFIAQYAKVNKNEASQFFDNLLKCKDDSLHKNIDVSLVNSLWRKPIIMVEDMYISIFSIFNFAIFNIVQDLKIGEVSFYSNLKDKLNPYYNERNNKFEIEVKLFLETQYENAIIEHNICENFFKLADKRDFPGQMDILVLYNNSIYLIECKNYNLKITQKSEQNLLGRINKKELRKMEKKVIFIKEHKEYILNKYNQNSNEYDDNVKGIIAISNFVGLNKIGDFDIVNYKDIILI